MTAGRCLCEKIQVEFDTPPLDANYCHCSLCRRMTGSAFGAYGKFPEADLAVRSGEDSLRSFAVTGKMTMHFCGGCGTMLYTTHEDYPGFVYVSLGILDGGDELQPTCHEWVGSKAPWYEILDDLPQFDEWSNQ